jgi:DNA-binding NarL/FixJ family response regulator
MFRENALVVFAPTLKKDACLMKPLSVVVYQCNHQSAESLAQSLYNHFRLVNVACDLAELRRAIPRHSADVAIVDLEQTQLEDIRQLREDFAATSIVCTHRLADERMWAQALAAGAVDCCAGSDVRAIVLAASHTPVVSHAHAA